MYHRVILVGNLGRDPEMRFTPAGDPITTFSVAVEDGFGERQKTIWFRVSTFGKQAESCNEYLVKGQQVAVEGRVTTDENGNPRLWQGSDGAWHANNEIVADRVKFGRKPGGHGPDAGLDFDEDDPIF